MGRIILFITILAINVISTFAQSERYLKNAYDNVNQFNFDKAEKNYNIYRNLSGNRDYLLEAKLKIRYIKESNGQFSYNQPIIISFKDDSATQLASKLDEAMFEELINIVNDNNLSVSLTAFAKDSTPHSNENANHRARHILTKLIKKEEYYILTTDINPSYGNEVIIELKRNSTATNKPISQSQPTKQHIIPDDCIDLGLSVLWATCNVGASRPQDFGEFYSWGELEPKLNYNKNNTKTYGIPMKDISGNPQYDVATHKKGDGWRMPTRTEFDELIDNTTHQWTTVNGVKGILATSKINGNSIFLPACGYRNGAGRLPGGNTGGYWSSTPSDGDSQFACSMIVLKDQLGYNSYERHGGFCVRPVHSR